MDFHPFNPYKLLAQYHRWSKIKEFEPIPQPAIISLDPINACNLRCDWCNSQKVIDNSNRYHIRTELLLQIPSFLAGWQGVSDCPKGVPAVCIAGGGEPLLHEAIDSLIVRFHDQGIKVGVITNGIFVHDHLESLSLCHFVGVSVDAATKETYHALKGVDAFDLVMRNIHLLTRHALLNHSPLDQGSGRGVGFKFLAVPANIHEIAYAAEMAKELECNIFHVRPADVGWFNKETLSLGWQSHNIERFHEEMKKAASVKGILVKGVTDKFHNDFSRVEIPYPKCIVGTMTGVIAPSGTNGIRFSICCDRKGDDKTILIDDTSNLDDIASVWGSQEHWNLCYDLDLKNCPRCTYLNYLNIYYGAILDDSMNIDMI